MQGMYGVGGRIVKCLGPKTQGPRPKGPGPRGPEPGMATPLRHAAGQGSPVPCASTPFRGAEAADTDSGRLSPRPAALPAGRLDQIQQPPLHDAGLNMHRLQLPHGLPLEALSLDAGIPGSFAQGEGG